MFHRLWDFLFRPRPDPFMAAVVEAHRSVPFTSDRLPVEITEDVPYYSLAHVDVDRGCIVAYVNHDLTIQKWTAEKPAQKRFHPPRVQVPYGREGELKQALREALPGAQEVRIFRYNTETSAYCAILFPDGEES